MSQFSVPAQQTYYDPTSPPEGERRRSGLAITSLVLSILGIIPCCGIVLAPVGVLLGVIGVFVIGPPKRGKGMCVASIIIGLIFTAIWGGVIMWSMAKIVRPMQEGPAIALREGFAGNISGFKAEFVGPAANASDSEVQAFIDALRAKYGEFRSLHMDQQPGRGQPQPQMGQPEFPVPYRIDFTNQSDVSATAVFVIADEATNTFAFKWGSLKIGDIEYPAPSGSPSSTGRPRNSTPAQPATSPPATAPNG